MKITLAVLLCASTVIIGAPKRDILCERTKAEIPPNNQVLSTLAIMTKNGMHIGTGLGIAPYKVLSIASAYFKYFKMAEYGGITVYNVQDRIHHKILLIETQKGFTVSLAHNVAVITLEDETPLRYFHGSENNLLLPISSVTDFYITQITRRFNGRDAAISFRQDKDCSFMNIPGLLCASPILQEINFDNKRYLGSPVFGKRGDLIGIMTKFSGYVLEDKRRAFIVTLIYPPYNYDFVEAAMLRTDDEMICYKAEQEYDAWRNQYPLFTYSP